jgi:hypothetical protein
MEWKLKKMNTPHINKAALFTFFVLTYLLFILVGCGVNPNAKEEATYLGAADTTLSPVESSGEIQVVITGGHDTDPRDNGRPVVLIASALGVPSEVFREAFSHVNPAPAGEEPNSIQVGLNKSVLLDVLGPYGVTNDLLDTVSNYYRYNRSAGETWPQTAAAARAIVTNGVIAGIVITAHGSGYTSAPVITILNSDVTARATLSFTTDFNTNGSLSAITLDPQK